MTASELKQARTVLGLSQEKLAIELGISWTTVNRYENGRAEIPRAIGLAIVHLINRSKTMDQIISTISEANNNPALREDLIADLWNSDLGKRFESPEAVDAALTAGSDPALIAAARKWLGLPIFE